MTDQPIQLPFFVYGTLLPGETYYPLWRDAIDEVRPALMTCARLYSLGRFPMLIGAPDGEVRGMAVWVRPSSYRAALALLDRLEGVDLLPHDSPGYRRVRRIVRPLGRPPVVAWVYVGHPAFIAGAPRIGPDWKSYLRGLRDGL